MGKEINGKIISYDYGELIKEFKADMIEGLLGEVCWIVRGDEQCGYRPITDYYYDLSESGQKVELAKTQSVLDEMIEMNKLF